MTSLLAWRGWTRLAVFKHSVCIPSATRGWVCFIFLPERGWKAVSPIYLLFSKKKNTEICLIHSRHYFFSILQLYLGRIPAEYGQTVEALVLSPSGLFDVPEFLPGDAPLSALRYLLPRKRTDNERCRHQGEIISPTFNLKSHHSYYIGVVWGTLVKKTRYKSQSRSLPLPWLPGWRNNKWDLLLLR